MEDALIAPKSSSTSEIPLVRRVPRVSSMSSASLSPPDPAEPPAASNPSGGSGGNNAALASGEPVEAMPMRSGSTPAAAALAAATTDEDVSKFDVDLAIMGCTITLLMTMAVTIGGLGWETPWKVLYGSLMIVSFVSTITGFITAVAGRARRSRLSPSCARLGLLVAAALFVVFLSCRLARFGCLGGVVAAAAVVVVLAVAWVLSEPPAAEAAAAEEGASVVSLPPDAP